MDECRIHPRNNSCAKICTYDFSFLVPFRLAASVRQNSSGNPRLTTTTVREREEYTALRATIRERGTARVWVFVAGFTAWGALAVATAALTSIPVASLLPLLVLAAIFEAVFALHVGVERVGRYLQVFHETGDRAAWERTAMAFGRPKGGAVADALFAIPFLLAALFNIVPALIAQPTPAEIVFVVGAHALFVLRLAVARAAAARQRVVDLERFQVLKDSEVRSTKSEA